MAANDVPMVKKNTWQVGLRRYISNSSLVGPLAVFIVVFLLLSFFVDKFLTFRSITGIINAATMTGVVTVGVTMLMIGGEFDLSVGSILATGGYIFASLAMDGKPWLGLFMALVGTGLMGMLNGLILVRTRIPSFIVTLGTRYFYRGMLWLISGGQMLQTVDKISEYNLFNGRINFLNNLFQGANFRSALVWLLILVIVFQFILTRTTFGNHVFAVGGNPGAALGQGVNVKRVRISMFIITGVLAGFTGVLLFSQYTTVRVASGDGMELSAIAAAVVGGALITGGAGSIWGALIGVLTIGTLRTGVVLMQIPFIPADNFEAIVGVTIILAVILNNWLRSRT